MFTHLQHHRLLFVSSNCCFRIVAASFVVRFAGVALTSWYSLVLVVRNVLMSGLNLDSEDEADVRAAYLVEDGDGALSDGLVLDVFGGDSDGLVLDGSAEVADNNDCTSEDVRDGSVEDISVASDIGLALPDLGASDSGLDLLDSFDPG